MKHLTDRWHHTALLKEAMSTPIPVEHLSPVSDGRGYRGWVKKGRTVLAYRGFGSWQELKDAVRSGIWKSRGGFNTRGEGNLQMAWNFVDVLESSGFHPLRGTGFLAIMEADIQGLPFETRNTGDMKLSRDGTEGVFLPDTGLGIGIITGVPVDRVKRVMEVEDDRVVRAWPFREWESHVDRVRDNPNWSGMAKCVVVIPRSRSLMHVLKADQNSTRCGTRVQIGEKALIDPDDAWTRPENIRNFWAREGATFSIRESQRCPRCFPHLGGVRPAGDDG